jgi:hypothetical protein
MVINLTITTGAMRATPALALIAAALAACDGGSPTEPQPSPTATIMVDASAAWAYLALGTPAAPVAVDDAAASAAWDLGFNATAVRVNGGEVGPGGVVALCLCQNAGATDAEVLAMTPESELADFDAVRAADVPAATDPRWSATVFDTERWYRYNLAGNHQVSPTFQVYLVRRGDAVYKLQLVGYYGPAGETRRITARYAKLAG